MDVMPIDDAWRISAPERSTIYAAIENTLSQWQWDGTADGPQREDIELLEKLSDVLLASGETLIFLEGIA